LSKFDSSKLVALSVRGNTKQGNVCVNPKVAAGTSPAVAADICL